MTRGGEIGRVAEALLHEGLVVSGLYGDKLDHERPIGGPGQVNLEELQRLCECQHDHYYYYYHYYLCVCVCVCVSQEPRDEHFFDMSL